MSSATSFIALLAVKLPGLVPHFLGAPTRPAATATVSALRAAPRPLYPKATPGFLMKVGAVFSAALMVAGALQLSQDRGIFSHSQALRSPLNTGSGNNSSTIYFPYVVDPNLFSPPENLTLPGNLTDPQLASTTLGAQPMFFLLAMETDGNNSSLVIFTGSYSPSAARGAIPCQEKENDHAKDCKDASNGTGDTAFVPGDNCGGNGRGSQPQDSQNCTPCAPSNEGDNDTSVQGSHSHMAKNPPGKPPACPPTLPSQPLVWSLPHTIVTYPFPILGDGLANDGSILVASASLPTGFTDLFVSRDASLTWRFLTSAVGAGEGVAVGNDTAVLATIGASKLTMTTTQMDTNSSRSATIGPAQNASPVISVDGTVGVVASNPNGTIEYFASSDGGASFVYHLVGGYAAISTSDLFNRIGSTSLSVPGGIPGQVSAAVENDQVFALYTSSVNGRVEAFTTSSGDNGTTWLGPYSASAGNGAIMDPQVKVSPVGYAYATWRENSGGTWRVDQAVFRMDGRPLQPPSPLPLDAWEAGSSLQAPTVALDDLERPLYVWDTTGFLGPALQFTSGYLSPGAALATLTQGVKQLAPSDFAIPANNSTDKAYLLGLLTEIGQNLTATTHLTPGHRMNALRILETELYPSVTSIPLVLLCTLANVSCSIGPGDHGREHERNAPGAAPPLPSDGGGDDNESEDNETGAAPSTANVTHLIVNLTGAFVANKYLAIYADWLIEALGVGVLAPKPSDPTVSSNGDSISVSPVMWNPSVTRLDISFSFSGSQTKNDWTNITNGTLCYYSELITDSVTSQNTSVVVTDPNGNSHEAKFNSSTKLGGTLGGSETVYLTHLDPSISYGWSVTVTGQYMNVIAKSYWCPSIHHGGSLPAGITPGPAVPVGPVVDSAQFKLTDSPHPPVVQAVTSVRGDVPSLHWNSTALGQATVSIRNGNSAPLTPLDPTSAYVTEHDFVFPSTATGNYIASIDVQSVPGDSSVSGLTLSAGGPSTSPVISDSFTFTFTLDPSAVIVSMFSVSGVTSTSAQLTWWTYPKYLPSATLTYTEEASPSSGSETVSPLGCILFGGTAGCRFTAEVEGLSPLSMYVADASVRETISGVTYQGIDTVSFFTSGTFGLGTLDLPYDSITKEGGGENVQWSDLQIVGGHGVSFLNGSVTYSPASPPGQATTMPLESLMSVPQAPSEHQLNLSAGLALNATYNLQMTLNYSINGTPLELVSEPSTFTYLKDTSGDGLTDAEKTYGWLVTYSDVSGRSQQGHVTADRSLYSTNELVSDYVEKEFGLNPQTFDSAGSHMLDTWNLTFDLGTVNPYPTTGFEYWYENSTNPFAALPGGNPINGPYAWYNLTYGSGFPASQVGGDNHPWAANVLWPLNALADFENLMTRDNVGWLRAVTGTYSGTHTMTIWGKLSWGANSLAASTPGDGIPDGARVNPLYDEDLQVWMNFANIMTGGSYPGCGNAAQDDGFAIRMVARQGSSSGPAESSDYTSQAFADCSGPPDRYPDAIANYYLTLPVSASVQFQSVTLFFSVNTSTGSPPYTSLYAPISGCDRTYTFSVDMLQPPALAGPGGLPSYTLYGNANGQCASGDPSTIVKLGYTAVPAGVKAPTYLWLPDDNSTLSNLPTGLQRYAGEQDFVQVVANVPLGCYVTCQVTSSVPYPWGGAYTLYANQSADSQLVNFLVPRGQFLASPMGQAILNNSSLSTSGTPDPITGDSLPHLACYWQNNAVVPNGKTPPLCYAAGVPASGTSPTNPYFVSVVADTENCAITGSANCQAGGVPSNPALSSSPGNAAPALQAVITLNLSSPTDLNFLLAGLLVNRTVMPNGKLGVNGWFKPVTYELPTLGLNLVVMGALANRVEPNGGIFGYPVSAATPPTPSCTGLCSLWNAVSGVVTLVTGMIVGVVWNAVVAAATYFNHIVQGLAKFAEAAVSAAVAVLKTVAKALEAALQALMAFVIQQAEALLNRALNFVFSPITSAMATMTTTLGFLISIHTRPGTPMLALAQQFWQPTSQLFMELVLAAEVVWIIMGIISLVIAGPSTILTGLIIGLFISALFATVSFFDDTLVSGIQKRLVWDTDGFVNCTTTKQIGYGCSPGSITQQKDQSTWVALAEIASIVNAGFLVSTVATMFSAVSSGALDGAGAVGFALSIVGLSLTWYFLNHPDQALAAELSLVMDLGSLALDWYSLTKSSGPGISGPLKTATDVITGVSIGMDVGSGVTDWMKWECTQHNTC